VSTPALLRVGVLGVGRIGKMHAELVARHVPGLALAAVYDVDEKAARRVARDLGAAATASADELLARPDVDAVAICTSTDTHVGLLVAAAATRKPVFLEKPVSLDLEELDRGLAVVRDAGLYVQVGFNRRFDPAHRSVHSAVAAGEVGDIHLLRITSRDPEPPALSYIRVSGGIFLDMTIHDFDMARYVTGSEVEEVYASGEVRVDSEIGEAGDLDTAVVVLRHASGALTTIDNSRKAVYGYDQRVEAFGSKGMSASENPLAHTGIRRGADGSHAALLPFFFLDRYVPSYVAEWAAFECAVREGAPSPVDGADGRAALVLGLAAWRSVREARPVRTDEIS
jgi:myo-inositol 2-dehydrogenase/D-chiro-inositol 1-dehydrogenase